MQKALQKIEMLNFTRRYPKLLSALLRQMVDLVHGFEEQMFEMENRTESKTPPNNPLNPSEQSTTPQLENSNLDPSATRTEVCDSF